MLYAISLVLPPLALLLSGRLFQGVLNLLLLLLGVVGLIDRIGALFILNAGLHAFFCL
jgi:uncharacterized membrane protein YqaE (UPF0057 family)